MPTMQCLQSSDILTPPSSTSPPPPRSDTPVPPNSDAQENDKVRFILHDCQIRRHQHSRERCGPMSTPDVMSVQEHHALPPLSQQKNFPHYDRSFTLRHVSSHKRKQRSSNDMARRSSSSSDNHARPKTSLGFRRRSSRTSASHRPGQESVSEADVQWFQALPEKIQRQQFSREERMMFASRVPKPVQFTPLLRTDSHPTKRPSTSGAHVGHQPQLFFREPPSSLQPEIKIGQTNASTKTEVAPSQPSTVETGVPDEQIGSLPPRKSSSASSHISNSTQSSRPSQSSSLSALNSRKKRHTASRALALTPIKLPPPKLMPVSKPSQASSPFIRRSVSSPRLLQSPTFLDMDTSPELGPSKLLDHATRRQLREALSSEAKFDAMLRHGLPSPPAELPRSISKSTSSSVRTMSQRCSPCSERSFFGDDDEADERDDRSISTTRDPITPTTVPDELKLMNRKSNTTVATRRLFQSVPEAAPREMTLRLTLTRPDLRTSQDSATATATAFLEPSSCTCNTSAIPSGPPSQLAALTAGPNSAPPSTPAIHSARPEILLYRAQRTANSGVEIDEDDPLALEPLPAFCDDDTGMHGVFARTSVSTRSGNHGDAFARSGHSGELGRGEAMSHQHERGLMKVWRGLSRRL